MKAIKTVLKLVLLAAGLALSIASVKNTDSGGPTCRTGCRCGDSCIDCSKRCTK